MIRKESMVLIPKKIGQITVLITGDLSQMMPPRPGTFTPPMAGMRPRYPGPGGPGYPPDGRFPTGRAEGDEPVTRPIIRDEELNKMDEIARDPGWAANEDIDYKYADG